MGKQEFLRWRIGVTVLVAVAAWAFVLWQHLHGGIPSHHLLHKENLPAVSNLWSGLLLPALTWFLSGRTRRRLLNRGDDALGNETIPADAMLSAIAGFVAALAFGIAVSVSFTIGRTDVSFGLFCSLPVLALLLPIHRAECVLGFILGMSATFGAVLPTGFGTVFAAIAAVIHGFIRPVFVWIGKKLRRQIGGD